MSPHLKARRHCDGGESVDSGESQTRCAYCRNGICLVAMACEVPLPEPPKRRCRISRQIVVGVVLWAVFVAALIFT